MQNCAFFRLNNICLYGVSRMRFIFFLFCCVFVLPLCAFGEDWSNWRGPNWNGTVDVEKLPLAWGEDSNIKWKTELPAWGNNTPIIVGDSIFLSVQRKDDDQMLVMRLDKRNGKILWEWNCGKERTPRNGDRPGFRGWQKFHDLQNLATPSLVADKEVVIAHFGNGDTYAFDWDGNKLWNNNLQELYGEFTIWWGHGASPLLYENLVVIPVMQDTCEDMEQFEKPVESYLVAFDRKTGKEVWKILRNTGSKLESCDAYTTPVIWKHENRTELILLGGETLDAYDPVSGKRLWWLDEGLECIRIVPSPIPVEKTGMIYLVRGKSSPICAVKPEGLGKQKIESIIWTHRQNTPDVPCPVSNGELLFSVNDRGITYCFDAKTGEIFWNERLPGGTYYPSPLLADGKLYLMNTDGGCTVLEASKEFKKLAENKLDGRFLSSIIVDGNDLILRSHTHIYRIGK